MLILSRANVETALPMADAIAAAAKAYVAYSSGVAEVPLRTAIRCAEGPGVALFMPGRIPGDSTTGSSGTLGAKIITLYDDNPRRGLPTTQAVFILLDPDDGRPLALFEAGALTAIRTGAGSGVATQLLARPDATVAAIFGAGVQARTQLLAIVAARPLERVLVYDPDSSRAAIFAAKLSGELAAAAPGIRVEVASDPDAAAASADIIACATTSATPVFSGAVIRPGTHINAVGAYTPDRRELDATLLQRASRVIVDSRAAVMGEAGDVLIPIGEGLFDDSIIQAEIGELLLGKSSGRRSADEITVFKAVGMAALDLTAAQVAYARAREHGIGIEVALS